MVLSAYQPELLSDVITNQDSMGVLYDITNVLPEIPDIAEFAH
jgi:hypothetical protein